MKKAIAGLVCFLSACGSVVVGGSGGGGAGVGGTGTGGESGASTSTTTTTTTTTSSSSSTTSTSEQTWFCAGSVACCSNPACPAPNLCECVFDEQVIAASAEDAAQLLLQECRDHHLDKSCGLWSLICDDKPVDPGPCP